MVQDPILLIIDPGLVAPCLEAVNCISKIMGEFSNKPEFAFHHVEYFSPILNKKRLKDFVHNKIIGAVICLGSLANVTDNLPSVQNLITDIKEYIFKPHIPFFGICFSHQMFASMSGYKVFYLKERLKIQQGKHHGFRELTLVHPKFLLLATNLKSVDYFSNNLSDMNFKEFIKKTNDWGQKQWEILATPRPWILTPFEHRLNEHIKLNTSKSIVSHARHEQEVWEKESSSDNEIVLAGTSPTCVYEALVHCQKPFFSLQTHPETSHQSFGGYRIIKNFIYMSSLMLL